MYSESYLLFNMTHDTVRGFFGTHNHMHQYVNTQSILPLELTWPKESDQMAKKKIFNT